MYAAGVRTGTFMAAGEIDVRSALPIRPFLRAATRGRYLSAQGSLTGGRYAPVGCSVQPLSAAYHCPSIHYSAPLNSPRVPRFLRAAASEDPLTDVKGGAKGLRMLVGTNVGNLCQRTSSVPRLLISPVSATSRSRFCTYAVIERNKSSLRNRDSDVGFTGAVCTISSNYPTKGRWGCKVKAATHSLAMSSILTCLLFVSMIFWEMARAKKLKRLVLASRSFFPSAPMDYNTDHIRPASHRPACTAEGTVILSVDEARKVARVVAMFLFLQKAAILREKKRSNIKRILAMCGLMCVCLWVGFMSIKGDKWAVDLVKASEKGEKVWKIISAVAAIFK